MSPSVWFGIVIALIALVAVLTVLRPFGRASRYVALILVAYTILWAGVGRAVGYTNPWLVGSVLVVAIADLAALPWWLRHVDRDTS